MFSAVIEIMRACTCQFCDTDLPIMLQVVAIDGSSPPPPFAHMSEQEWSQDAVMEMFASEECKPGQRTQTPSLGPGVAAPGVSPSFHVTHRDHNSLVHPGSGYAAARRPQPEKQQPRSKSRSANTKQLLEAQKMLEPSSFTQAERKIFGINKKVWRVRACHARLTVDLCTAHTLAHTRAHTYHT